MFYIDFLVKFGCMDKYSRVIALVAETYCLPIEDVNSTRVRGRATRARQLAACILRNEYALSFSDIGHILVGKWPEGEGGSSKLPYSGAVSNLACSSYNRATDLLVVDPAFRRDYDACIEEIRKLERIGTDLSRRLEEAYREVFKPDVNRPVIKRNAGYGYPFMPYREDLDPRFNTRINEKKPGASDEKEGGNG